MALRRYARKVVWAAIMGSFTVSAVLFLTLIFTDESTRLCRAGQEEVEAAGDEKTRQSSSVLRQLNIALKSDFNNKLPVYSCLISHNNNNHNTMYYYFY